MTDWSGGYRVDVDYTHGYYAELNPLNMNFAMVLAGFRPPEVRTACELGYGHGVSLNIHAASSSVAWWGTDFNPTHAAFAQQLAKASGSAALCYNDTFAEFAERSDLPEFDFIALHGVWSWVSPENRRAILRLIDRKLKVGGVVYVGYNTLPGSAPVLPLQELIVRHVEMMTRSCDPVATRIDETLEFLERLVKIEPAAVRASPAITERLASLRSQDRKYLAHEYLNADWEPQSIATMADQFSSARLTFACPARFLESVDAINLTAAQSSLLSEVENPVLRELLRDFILNRFFRHDYWVKGAQRLAPEERMRRLRRVRIMLMCEPEEVTLKVVGALGEAELLKDIYGVVIDSLKTREPICIDEIEENAKLHGVTFNLALEAITVLLGKGVVALVQPELFAGEAQSRASRLNHHLISTAEHSSLVAVLASGVLGGGIAFDRISQIMIGIYLGGAKTASELAEGVLSILANQGEKLIFDGRICESEEDSRSKLITLAEAFLAKKASICEKWRLFG